MEKEIITNEEDTNHKKIEQLCSNIEHLKGEYDEAIVILGRGISPGYQNTGKTPWIGRLREIAGVISFYEGAKEGKSPIIIITGGLEDNDIEGPSTESSIMKEELMKYQIPEDKIIIDEQAYDTSTNAQNVSEILKTLGFLEQGEVKLITDKFHLKRAKMLFGKNFSGDITSTDAEGVIIEFDKDNERYKLPGEKIKKPYREFVERFVKSPLYTKLMLQDFSLRQITKFSKGEKYLRKMAQNSRVKVDSKN